MVVPFSAGWGSPEQPDSEESLYLLQQWQEESDLFVFALIDGPFSAAAKAWGWEGALTHLSAPGRAELEMMAEATLELAEQARALAARGADGILLGDDIAYRRSAYINPGQPARELLPLPDPVGRESARSRAAGSLPFRRQPVGGCWTTCWPRASTACRGWSRARV